MSDMTDTPTGIEQVWRARFSPVDPQALRLHLDQVTQE